MGIGRALRLLAGVESLATASTVTLGGGDVAQVATLPTEVATAFGISTATDTVTRSEAMSVPAVRRGRQVIAGTLGTLPLVALRTVGTGPDRKVERVEAPHATARLLEQPDPNVTRAHVLTRTVDDLLFHPTAWWRVLDRDGSTGYPINAEHIALHRVRVDVTERRVYIDGAHVPDRDLIRFDGPDDGVLVNGARAIRTCLRLEDAARRLAQLDIPLGILTPEEGAEELTDTEVDELLAAWTTARTSRNWAYLNRAVKAEAFQFDAAKLQLAEQRAQATADIARLLNLPPSMVNAASASSMTYTNTEAERRALLDLSLAPYVAAIEQRLSMTDVTPAGHRVAFDVTRFLQGTTRELLEAAKVGLEAGVLTRDEVRVEWLNRPALPPDAVPAPSADEESTP